MRLASERDGQITIRGSPSSKNSLFYWMLQSIPCHETREAFHAPAIGYRIFQLEPDHGPPLFLHGPPQTRIGMRTYSWLSTPLGLMIVGEPGSSKAMRTSSPSISPRISAM